MELLATLDGVVNSKAANFHSVTDFTEAFFTAKLPYGFTVHK